MRATTVCEAPVAAGGARLLTSRLARTLAPPAIAPAAAGLSDTAALRSHRFTSFTVLNFSIQLRDECRIKRNCAAQVFDGTRFVGRVGIDFVARSEAKGRNALHAGGRDTVRAERPLVHERLLPEHARVSCDSVF